MKRKTRPFAVEIKGVRKRSGNNLFGRLPSHDGDAQPRGANQDLAAMWASFGQITNDGAHNNVVVLDCATPASPIVERQIRVLPDLREVASNEAPVLKKARRPRPAKPDQVLEPAYHESDELAIQVGAEEVEPLAVILTPVKRADANLGQDASSYQGASVGSSDGFRPFAGNEPAANAAIRPGVI